MIKTVTIDLGGTTYALSSYTASGVCKGNLINQYADGAGKKYLQPIKYNPFNIWFESNNSYGYYPTAIPWSDDVDYIFMVSGSYAMTSYISLIKYSRSSGAYSFVGRIHFTPTSGTPNPGQPLSGQQVNTTYNYRAPVNMDACIYRYTSGTVQVSSRVVTGLGTTFMSSGIATGARIGFGTTDHTLVDKWYDIEYITSDTVLGITSSIPYSATFSEYSAGTPYVIEEIRLVFTMQRNVIRQIGQLMLVKGLHENVFGYKDIPEATNIDNMRAFYNLYPGTASPTFSTTWFAALVLDAPESDSVHYCYALDHGTHSALIDASYAGAGLAQAAGIYKFNIKASLNFVSGTAAGMSYSQAYVSTNAYVTNTYRLKTISNYGDQWQYSYNAGVMSLGTPNHGPTKGQKTLFFNGSSRILAVPVSLVDNSYDFIPNAWSSISHRNLGPGTPVQNWAFTNYTYQSGVTSYNKALYVPSIDSFMCSYFPAAVGNWPMTVEKFGQPSSKMFFQFIRFRTMFSNPAAGEYFSANRDTVHYSVSNGIMHTQVRPNAQNTGQQFLYAIPLHADYAYALDQGQYVTTPAQEMPVGAKPFSVKLNIRNTTDDDSMRVPPGRTRIWVRTSGIDSNTGTWSRVPDNGDISGITASRVQFAFAWEILSTTAVVPYAYSFDFVYETDGPERYYFSSKEKSDMSANQFAFIQTQTFGGAIPNLRIRLYDFETDAILLEDSTEAKSQGTWQYSSNAGVSWATWSSVADNVGNYIRYTANSLPANVSIRPQITVGGKKDFVFNI